MDFPSWDQMSNRDQLLSGISDTHKEAYGVRPRRDFSTWTETQLSEYLTDLHQTAAETYEEERREEAERLEKFRGTLAKVRELCSCDDAAAIRYLMDAEEEDDIEHFFYRQGLHWVSIHQVEKEYGLTIRS